VSCKVMVWDQLYILLLVCVTNHPLTLWDDLACLAEPLSDVRGSVVARRGPLGYEKCRLRTSKAHRRADNHGNDNPTL